MLWAVLAHLAGFVVDLVAGVRRTEDAKDLEIALLRHQLRLLLRLRIARPASSSTAPPKGWSLTTNHPITVEPHVFLSLIASERGECYDIRVQVASRL